MSTLSCRSAWPGVGGVTGVLVISAVFLRVLHIHNTATVSTTFLLVVLLVAASSTLVAAVTTSLIAVLCFNFFFLPPVRTFSVADPQNWVALIAFLVVSVVGSNLSARVRSRAEEASARRAELARLYNAAQHAPAGSTIDLMTRREEGALLVLVRDHGPGIPVRDLPHLFERFYRGTGGARRPAGTGMGLWIARGLLVAAGAHVWGENAPDGGALFTIRLPDQAASVDAVPRHD
jgi:K+-sensing histidine kinase KdpD